MRLSAADAALVGTIYNPPRAHQPWLLKDVLPDGATRYYSLARWALVDALRACGAGAGDVVLIPGLICREVMASINILGAVAAFYPVSRQLCAAFEANRLREAKAVVAVNYFGFPQNLDIFHAYCARTGAALIEDNAHGLLSRDESGRLLGSRGDVGIFSFRKTIAVPNGGALVLNRDQKMPPPLAAPSVNGVGPRYRVKQAFRRVGGRLGPVRTHNTIATIRQLRRVFTGNALPVSVPDAEMRIPLGPNPCALIERALTIADPASEIKRRRSLYDLAGRIVKKARGVPVFPDLPANVAPYGFPIFASSTQASEIAADASRCGLQLSQWPELATAVAPSAPEHYRQLMVLPFLW